jgi:uncharacterized protein YjbI with pentapeptide repeats
MINNESFEDELDQIIQLVQEANTDNFFKLAEILGRNPKTDYAGANLPKCDLSGGDLEGANLRKTNLSSANLRGTNLRGADLSYSDISGADFTDADLTGTNFHQVQAENAVFCNNIGLYERLRLDLIDKGARFVNLDVVNTEDIPENKTSGQSDKISSALRERLNLDKVEKIYRNPRQFNLYENKFIAIWNGEVIASEDDEIKRQGKIETFLFDNPDYDFSDILEAHITQELKMPIDV